MTVTAARDRIDKYAAMVPTGATFEIVEDDSYGIEVAQLMIKGSIDTVLVTVSNRPGRKRTRATGSRWFNWGSKSKPIRVREIGYRIRSLYVDTRES